MTGRSNTRGRGAGEPGFTAEFLFSLLLLLGSSAGAQILDSERMTDWMPGLPDAIPVRTAAADVRDFGAVGDSLSDEAPAFIAAIASLPPDGGTVRIPAGRYLLRQGLRLDRGIVLSGEGFRNTRLYFDLDGRVENAVGILKPVQDDWSPALGGLVRGGRNLQTERADRFSGGDFLEITRDNDPLLMYTNAEWNQDWAVNAVGQIVQVESVDGNRVRIRTPLYLDYPENLNPKIRRLDPVLYAGLEKLSLMRLDSGLGDMILLKHAAFCRISEVESAFTSGNHVFLHTAFQCEVTDGYFHHAHGYGAGGQGYGVDCATHSTDNLIENNIFDHLRHALMAQVGASGNVFGYNYSRMPMSDEGIMLADLSLHGHYSNYNLFEGNIVQSIGIGDYWGPAGPGNVFLRNEAESGTVNVEDFSHGQSFVGNFVRSESGEGIIRIHPSVQNTLLHGNQVGKTVQWDPLISSRDIPFSYYLDWKPGFWGDSDWPFQAGTGGAIPELPAKRRFQEGSFIAPDTGSKPPQRGPELSVYPNPSEGWIHLRFFIHRSCGAALTLVDMRGRTIRTFWKCFLERGSREWTVDLDEGGRPAPGLYMLVLTMDRMRLARKITVL
jgi:hypothetical protein